MQKLPVREVLFLNDIVLTGGRGMAKLINDKVRPQVELYVNEHNFLVVSQEKHEDMWIPMSGVLRLIPCPQQQTTSSKSKKAPTKAQKSKESGTELPQKLF